MLPMTALYASSGARVPCALQHVLPSRMDLLAAARGFATSTARLAKQRVGAIMATQVMYAKSCAVAIHRAAVMDPATATAPNSNACVFRAKAPAGGRTLPLVVPT